MNCSYGTPQERGRIVGGVKFRIIPSEERIGDNGLCGLEARAPRGAALTHGRGQAPSRMLGSGPIHLEGVPRHASLRFSTVAQLSPGADVSG